jgi:hypothetical protein
MQALELTDHQSIEDLSVLEPPPVLEPRLGDRKEAQDSEEDDRDEPGTAKSESTGRGARLLLAQRHRAWCNCVWMRIVIRVQGSVLRM